VCACSQPTHLQKNVRGGKMMKVLESVSLAGKVRVDEGRAIGTDERA